MASGGEYPPVDEDILIEQRRSSGHDVAIDQRPGPDADVSPSHRPTVELRIGADDDVVRGREIAADVGARAETDAHYYRQVVVLVCLAILSEIDADEHVVARSHGSIELYAGGTHDRTSGGSPKTVGSVHGGNGGFIFADVNATGIDTLELYARDGGNTDSGDADNGAGGPQYSTGAEGGSSTPTCDGAGAEELFNSDICGGGDGARGGTDGTGYGSGGDGQDGAGSGSGGDDGDAGNSQDDVEPTDGQPWGQAAVDDRVTVHREVTGGGAAGDTASDDGDEATILAWASDDDRQLTRIVTSTSPSPAET